MKRLILLLTVLLVLPCAALKLSAQNANQRTIAVMNFDNNSITDKDQLEPLKTGMADMLSTEMANIEAFKVVERKKLKDLLAEMSLGQSGVLEASTAQQVGKLLGAQTLLLGGFVNMFGGQMRIDVRIVEVETGLTLKAVEETGKVDDLFDMIKSLTKKISRVFEVKLTTADKKRMEAEKGSENFEATLYYSKGIEFEDQGRVQLKNGDQAKAREMFRQALSMFEQAVQKSQKFDEAKMKIQETKQMLQSL